MPVVADHEKVFKYFLHLPTEIGIMVVDEMPQIDKCVFQGCSIISQKLVGWSKQKINSLRLLIRSSNYIEILVHCKENYSSFFELKFSIQNGQKCIQCLSWNSEEMWKIELTSSADLVDKATQYFEMYQKWTKVSNMISVRSINIDFDIEKIYSITNTLDLPHLKLNNEQFLKLSASRVHIHIGELRMRDIFNFVTSWQNGEIRDNFRECRWNWEGSGFIVEQFSRLFGGTIQSKKDAGKFASLFPASSNLVFLVRE